MEAILKFDEFKRFMDNDKSFSYDYDSGKYIDNYSPNFRIGYSDILFANITTISELKVFIITNQLK